MPGKPCEDFGTQSSRWENARDPLNSSHFIQCLAKTESRPPSTVSFKSLKRRFLESRSSYLDHRILKSPYLLGDVTIRRRRTVFAGTVFFRFAFFWVSKRKWTTIARSTIFSTLRDVLSFVLIQNKEPKKKSRLEKKRLKTSSRS